MASTQFDHAVSNPGRKLRVVAKIRAISGPDNNSGSFDWISVNRENSDEVTISFGEQSSSQYLVDYCYNEHEDNETIYSREVKPLISAVFEGHNSTVIAHGARGSGKTHVIQGSIEKPGLAVLATADFLCMAEENQKSIAVSFYEVDHQDHAVDLLNPEQPPISVLEDHGKIQFKGLTQIPVKSIAEFQNLYLTACSAHKAAPKKGFEPARRSHMGLIVHVFSQNESIKGLVSKMNFVDMAGYEDARRKSSDGSGLADTTKINKSVYALLNVCHSLCTNESRIPYRESKLTRMLQDSLRGTSKILLVTCLNPTFCQDTIYMVSLASRSCQWIHRTPLASMKKSESSARQKATSHKNQLPKKPLDSTQKSTSSARHMISHKNPVPNTLLDSTQKSVSLARQKVTSHKNQVPKTPLDSTQKSVSSTKQKMTSHKNHLSKTPLDSIQKSVTSGKEKMTSNKNQMPKNVSARTKILPNSRSNTLEFKKKDVAKSAIKGRKLFGEAGHSASKAEKENSISQAPEPLLENSISHASEPLLVIDQLVYQMRDNSLYEAGSSDKLNYRVDKNNSPPDASNIKLNMMTENVMDGLSFNTSSEAELDSIVEKGISEDKEEDLQEKHTPCAGNYSKALSTVDEGGHNTNEEKNLMENGDPSPPISSQLRDLQSLCSSTPLCRQIPETECISLSDQISTEIEEPRTPLIEQNMCPIERRDILNAKSPWETFSMRSSGMKKSLVQEYLRFLNTAEKEELKKLKGIGEKRATFILELREESPEPFKSLDDLKDIGLSAKQIKGMMKKEAGELFRDF